MYQTIRRLIEASRREEGMTLVEVLVSLSLLTVVLAVFTNALMTSQAAVNRQSDRSTSNDQARLAIEQPDREIRSGNVLYDPCPNPAPAPPTFNNDPTNDVYPCQALLIYTQTNATTLNP